MLMQTDKFIIPIKLSNGIWSCDCKEINKNGKVHYEIDIAPPKDYEVKKLYKTVRFNFQPITFEFIFELWQFADNEYREILEEELSNKIIKRLLS